MSESSIKGNLLVLLCMSLFAWLMISFSACHDESVLDTPQINLGFSVDTLRFDTVFTELGTITRFFKIYNLEQEAVVIDDINLNSGQNTFFRLNADGVSGNDIKNIRVEPKDSIYVFVEATIDPDLPLSSSPFVIEDAVEIIINQSEYKVCLEAWGQNAIYFPDRFSKSQINSINCNNSTLVWDDPKPYVIYGVLVVDRCDLTIAAGTRVYMHGGVAINDTLIYNDGLLVITENSSLNTLGTPEAPVQFLSDRLEEGFQETSGQWAGVLIQAGSTGNRLEHTQIRHSIVGISVDSMAQVEMESCEFSFTSGSGINARLANITATNCLMYENGGSGISLTYGGDYLFNHCTVANYGNQSPALTATNFTCTDPLCMEAIFVNPLSLEMNNCILVGNEEDEISFVDATDEEAGFFNYQMDNCIVVIEDLLDTDAFPEFFTFCNNCENINRRDTLFLDLEMHDLHLDTLSLAIDIGTFIPGIETDFDGNPRETNAVDIGCYEFQK